MPVSYFKRPLFIVLALFLLARAASGPGRPPSFQLRPYSILAFRGRAVSPARRDWRGEKIVFESLGDPAGVRVLVYFPRTHPRAYGSWPRTRPPGGKPSVPPMPDGMGPPSHVFAAKALRPGARRFPGGTSAGIDGGERRGLAEPPVGEGGPAKRGETARFPRGPGGAVKPRPSPLAGLPRPGTAWLIRGKWRPGYAARNPGDFNERGFLESHGISGIVKAWQWKPLPGPVPLRWALAYWAEGFKRSVEDCWGRYFKDKDDRAILSGICFGDKGPMSSSLRSAVQDSGVMHLLVPSGTKVALVMAACEALGLGLGLFPQSRMILAALIGGFYTTAVGALAPYVRAYLAALALGAGYLLGRRSGSFQATVISALLIMLSDPRAAWDAGFQMSYLAVLGLVIGMPRTRGRVLGSLIATAIVEAMLWPLFAKFFGRGPVLGALANPLLIPLSAPLMALGFLIKLLDFRGLGRLEPAACALAGILIRAFKAACGFFSGLPLAAVSLSPFSPRGLALYYASALAILVLSRVRWKIAAAGLGAAAALFLGVMDRALAPPLGVLYFGGRLSGCAWLSFSGREHRLLLPRGGPSRGAGPAKGLRRALGALGVRDKGAGGLFAAPISDLRLGEVLLGFAPPRASRCRKGECSTIYLRPRKGALIVTTDGASLQIRPWSLAQESHGPPFL